MSTPAEPADGAAQGWSARGAPHGVARMRTADARPSREREAAARQVELEEPATNKKSGVSRHVTASPRTPVTRARSMM